MTVDAEAATRASGEEEFLVVSDGWGVYYAIPLDIAEKHKVNLEQQTQIEALLAQEELAGYMLAQRAPPVPTPTGSFDLAHAPMLTGTLLYLSVRSPGADD